VPVILLEPPRPKNQERSEDVVNAPLSSCLFTGYIAAVLRENNTEAKIINAHLYDWSIDQTIAKLSQESYSLLCVHVLYEWDKTREIFEMLSKIKSYNTNEHINIYGYYPTFAYKEILAQFPFIDSVTIGEPELTCTELATKLLNNKKKSLINIDGLAQRSENGKIWFRPHPLIRDLDNLPFPERADYDRYRSKGITNYILGSRGCYGQCTFCYLNPFYGQAALWRGRSAGNIFDEIYQLYTKYSIDSFYFSDPNFFGPGKAGQERASTLADLIIANNIDIRFGFECRVNDIEEKTLSKLVMAGLRQLFLGLESGDQSSLKRLKKHTTVEASIKAIRLLRNYGIETTFGFIMFEPYSTLKSIRNNFEFLKESQIMTTPVITAHLLHHRQTLFMGTPDYRTIIKDDASAEYSFTNYETFYTIKDPAVEAFSYIITKVCKTVLSMLTRTFDSDPTCLSAHETKMSGELNNALITAFEDTLSSLEKGMIVSSKEFIDDTSASLIRKIKAILS